MKNLFLFFALVLLIPVYSNAQYTPISVRSSSSNTRSNSSNNSETVGNISVTVGINGNWTFKFSSWGTFQSHVWYGNNGKYDTRNMRKESYSSGTYTIKNENGRRMVYLRYANGNETIEELEYRGGRAVLLTDYSGYSWKRHEQID